jgi:NAD(P)-dependent dehydrogenase (short-subunit alcohol dehydrogenase family)
MTAGALFDISLGDRPRRELAPGAVHVPSWLTSGQQQRITGQFREWTGGPVPVVNTASGIGPFGAANRIGYASSKAAVIGLTKGGGARRR